VCALGLEISLGQLEQSRLFGLRSHRVRAGTWICASARPRCRSIDLERSEALAVGAAPIRGLEDAEAATLVSPIGRQGRRAVIQSPARTRQLRSTSTQINAAQCVSAG
jgi:hypothetical protein